jgi:hypothetical protein
MPDKGVGVQVPLRHPLIPLLTSAFARRHDPGPRWVRARLARAAL